MLLKSIRVTVIPLASILMLCGCSSAPRMKPLADRHLIEMACLQQPRPPADRSLQQTTLALIDALRVIGECQAAIAHH